jgi:hypothetical protein
LKKISLSKIFSERLGFEPRGPVSQANSLAVSCFRPLSHLSNFPAMSKSENWRLYISKLALKFLIQDSENWHPAIIRQVLNFLSLLPEKLFQ